MVVSLSHRNHLFVVGKGRLRVQRMLKPTLTFIDCVDASCCKGRRADLQQKSWNEPMVAPGIEWEIFRVDWSARPGETSYKARGTRNSGGSCIVQFKKFNISQPDTTMSR